MSRNGAARRKRTREHEPAGSSPRRRRNGGRDQCRQGSRKGSRRARYGGQSSRHRRSTSCSGRHIGLRRPNQQRLDRRVDAGTAGEDHLDGPRDRHVEAGLVGQRAKHRAGVGAFRRAGRGRGASSSDRPSPSAAPREKLRDCREPQVSTRSPSPDRPVSVEACAPKATPKRTVRRSRAPAAPRPPRPRSLSRRRCRWRWRARSWRRPADLDAANIGGMVEAKRGRGQSAGETSRFGLVARRQGPRRSAGRGRRLRRRTGPERMAGRIAGQGFAEPPRS